MLLQALLGFVETWIRNRQKELSAQQICACITLYIIEKLFAHIHNGRKQGNHNCQKLCTSNLHMPILPRLMMPLNRTRSVRNLQDAVVGEPQALLKRVLHPNQRVLKRGLHLQAGGEVLETYDLKENPKPPKAPRIQIMRF